MPNAVSVARNVVQKLRNHSYDMMQIEQKKPEVEVEVQVSSSSSSSSSSSNHNQDHQQQKQQKQQQQQHPKDHQQQHNHKQTISTNEQHQNRNDQIKQLEAASNNNNNDGLDDAIDIVIHQNDNEIRLTTNQTNNTRSLSSASSSNLNSCQQQQQLQLHHRAAAAACVSTSVDQSSACSTGSVHLSNQDTRTHVVGELYDTERSYVESLQVLVEKYMKPLKYVDNNKVLIDSNLVDEIFYTLPEILEHHEIFLAALRDTLSNDSNSSQVIGNIFIDAFTDQKIIDTYTAFINNWKNARQAIKVATQAKPAFEKFLESMAREHKNKLTLDALLIMPVQRIPRYELLIKELIKHTNDDHPDRLPLLEAQDKVHSLALKIDQAEREMIHQERLKDLEGLIEGPIGSLQQPNRDFIRYDLVTVSGVSSSSFGSAVAAKKERVLFLFCDLLVMTSVKKKASRRSNLQSVMSNSYNDVSLLEGNKFKLLLRVSIDQVDLKFEQNTSKSATITSDDQTSMDQVVKQEEALKKFDRKRYQIESDLNMLRQLEIMSARLSSGADNRRLMGEINDMTHRLNDKLVVLDRQVVPHQHHSDVHPEDMQDPSFGFSVRSSLGFGGSSQHPAPTTTPSNQADTIELVIYNNPNNPSIHQYQPSTTVSSTDLSEPSSISNNNSNNSTSLSLPPAHSYAEHLVFSAGSPNNLAISEGLTVTFNSVERRHAFVQSFVEAKQARYQSLMTSQQHRRPSPLARQASQHQDQVKCLSCDNSLAISSQTNQSQSKLLRKQSQHFGCTQHQPQHPRLMHQPASLSTICCNVSHDCAEATSGYLLGAPTGTNNRENRRSWHQMLAGSEAQALNSSQGLAPPSAPVSSLSLVENPLQLTEAPTSSSTSTLRSQAQQLAPRFLHSMPVNSILNSQHPAMKLSCCVVSADQAELGNQMWLCLSNGYVSHVALLQFDERLDVALRSSSDIGRPRLVCAELVSFNIRKMMTKPEVQIKAASPPAIKGSGSHSQLCDWDYSDAHETLQDVADDDEDDDDHDHQHRGRSDQVRASGLRLSESAPSQTMLDTIEAELMSLEKPRDQSRSFSFGKTVSCKPSSSSSADNQQPHQPSNLEGPKRARTPSTRIFNQYGERHHTVPIVHFKRVLDQHGKPVCVTDELQAHATRRFRLADAGVASSPNSFRCPCRYIGSTGSMPSAVSTASSLTKKQAKQVLAKSLENCVRGVALGQEPKATATLKSLGTSWSSSPPKPLASPQSRNNSQDTPIKERQAQTRTPSPTSSLSSLSMARFKARSLRHQASLKTNSLLARIVGRKSLEKQKSAQSGDLSPSAGQVDEAQFEIEQHQQADVVAQPVNNLVQIATGVRQATVADHELKNQVAQLPERVAAQVVSPLSSGASSLAGSTASSSTINSSTCASNSNLASSTSNQQHHNHQFWDKNLYLNAIKGNHLSHQTMSQRRHAHQQPCFMSPNPSCRSISEPLCHRQQQQLMSNHQSLKFQARNRHYHLAYGCPRTTTPFATPVGVSTPDRNSSSSRRRFVKGSDSPPSPTFRSRSATVPCRAAAWSPRQAQLQEQPGDVHLSLLSSSSPSNQGSRSNLDHPSLSSDRQHVKVCELIDEQRGESTANNNRDHEDVQSGAGRALWLGSDDGTLTVIECLGGSSNLLSEQCNWCEASKSGGCQNYHSEIKFEASITDICANSKLPELYAAISNGQLAVFRYHRSPEGDEDPTKPQIMQLLPQAQAIGMSSKLCLLSHYDMLWYSNSSRIVELDILSNQVVSTSDVSGEVEEMKSACDCTCVWLMIKHSNHIQLRDAKSKLLLLELNVWEPINRVLSLGSEVIRQHKLACLRNTCILNVRLDCETHGHEPQDTLFIGTSAGIILFASITPELVNQLRTSTAADGQANGEIKLESRHPTIATLKHGHSGSVSLLRVVNQLVDSEAGTRGQYLVSGGLGLEVFGLMSDDNNNNSTDTFRTSTTQDEHSSHLIVWKL